jgi:Na+:H+ antiporter, NhaA family
VLHGAGLGALLHPVALGISAGLVLGKPIGITLATYIAAGLLKQRTPARLAQMIGMAMLAGIGFTMSLFVGNLAFGSSDLATPVRFGVLGGSLVSALLGLLVLWVFTRGASRHHTTLTPEEELAEARGVIEDIDAQR